MKLEQQHSQQMHEAVRAQGRRSAATSRRVPAVRDAGQETWGEAEMCSTLHRGFEPLGQSRLDFFLYPLGAFEWIKAGLKPTTVFSFLK